MRSFSVAFWSRQLRAIAPEPGAVSAAAKELPAAHQNHYPQEVRLAEPDEVLKRALGGL